MKNEVFAGISLIFSAAASAVEPPAGAAAAVSPAGLGASYSLDQFGPVGSPGDAAKTFAKASADIIAAGGGVLVIPAQTAPTWKPKNNSQEEWRKPPPPAPAKGWGAGA